MRRNVVIVMSMFMMMFMSACGGTNNQETDGQSSNDQSEVLIWHYYTGSADILEELIEEYNELQEDVIIRGEYVPFNEMSRQLSVGTAGDTLPDMIIADTVNNAALASMGILEDLTDRLEAWGQEENFLAGPMNSAIYEEQYYGLPITTNALGLFYNKTLFEEAGISDPPTTWDELEEMADQLTTSNVKGFGLSAVRSEESTFQFYPFLHSAGGDYRNLDSPEANKALSFIKNLLDQGYMSQDVLTATQDDLTRMFIAENLAMMVNGPWMIDRVNESGIEYGITYIPMDEVYASVTGGDNIAITSNGDVDSAWGFATWLLEREQNERFAMGTGYYPTRADVLEEADYWQNEDLVKEFVPIMEVAEPRGPSADWPNVSEAIQLAIQEALTGSKSVEEALSDAAVKIAEIEE
ncbi:ABC transporter substrate-binding protein [Halalkalibacter sp. APA_J-10(15)]|uniref:ABC transporter substrate-binding protein n=1 Tax=Halalkalibacter sp. APA_J-10(15) TaxID=2933805 RepID=UPI001FF23361|nr:ABC transporter substrate-binding protein [Halalkalibacter sp. APA_J-10(15)]MCK0470100.1 ABC transporter substrate-binding protein [Halalkalibacter sp. APA_J-10(15)]